eukprot:11170653-Lingulodinium_polyedra.AAC.1
MAGRPPGSVAGRMVSRARCHTGRLPGSVARPAGGSTTRQTGCSKTRLEQKKGLRMGNHCALAHKRPR